MLSVLCDQETCWKPYLTDRHHQIQTDCNDDDDIYNSDEETEAAICDCLHQYLQHSINVCSFFLFLASLTPSELSINELVNEINLFVCYTSSRNVCLRLVEIASRDGQ